MKNTKFTLNRICLTLSLTAILLTLASCSALTSQSPSPLTRSGLYFDTYITVSLYDTMDTTIMDEVFRICEQYDALFSPSIPNSDINRINSSSSQTITVDPATTDLISRSLNMCEESNGDFDITVYPAYKLWDFEGGSNALPDEEELSEALKHIDYHNITVDFSDNSITLADSDTQIDLGATAKGYIADRLKDYLITHNINSALINLGGDIITIGSKPDGNDFLVGIKDPDEENSIIKTITLSNKAVATSGTYERFVTVDGTRYHHILNPETGYPYDTDVKSATVITASATYADYLATECIILSSGKAIELINSLDDAEAIIITDNNDIVLSANAAEYVRMQ